MRRRVWTRLLLAGALIALACTGDRNQLPTQPLEFSKAGTPTCDVARITALINGLFPPGSTRGGAHASFASIRGRMNNGNTAQAQSAMFGFVQTQLAALRTGNLNDPTNRLGLTAAQAVAELIGRLYACVGLADQAPANLAAALDPSGTGGAAVVGPTDPPTVVETQGDHPAGVSIPTGAISETQTVLVTITPDPAGLNFFPNTSHFQEFQPFYNFETFPEVPLFHQRVLVGICVDITGLPYDQAHRLQLAHPRHPDPTALEVLARVDAIFLPCASYVHAGSDAVHLAQAGRTPFVSRLAQQALALLRPQQLYAATVLPGGVGGETESFSDFRAIDPGKLVFTQQPTNTAAGVSITPPPVVTVMKEDGITPITGDPGDITVVIGTNPSGGTLSGTTTVSTGSTGVATFTGLSINNPGTGYTLFAASDTTDAGAVPQPATSAAFDITSFTTLIDCGGAPSGDQLFRGFYVPGFPGTTLDRVTLHFSSSTAGLYTISLTARDGTYDGTILGTATATVTLTANDLANVATTFTFPSPAVTKGSTVTFSLALVSGPGGGVVFYSVPALGDATCPVVQTNGTNPPLDTFRRQGVHVKIEGIP